MKTLICKSWTFDAAHRLPKLPATHKCHHLHGHTYRLELRIYGEVEVGGEQAGMVIDYDLLDVIVQPVLSQLDHKYLNEVPGLDAAPTTELVARWIHYHLNQAVELQGARLWSVRVYESATTWAEVGLGVDVVGRDVAW